MAERYKNRSKYVGFLIAITISFFCVNACSKQTASQEAQPQVSHPQVSDPLASKKDIVVPQGMVLIPAGDFIMGTNEVDASGKSKEFGFNEPWYLPEHPQHKVYLDNYFIDKYEVTNAQFLGWLKSMGRYSAKDLQVISKRLKMKQDKAPVRLLSWNNATQYCKAIGKRLPTEAEWEKAARGTDGRIYPWGNKWNPDYANVGQNEQDLMPVGSYEKGKSPYGVYDMAGNVMEWTADWFEAYPGAEYKSPNYGHKRRVVRGGSWGGVGHYVIPHFFRTTYRFDFDPKSAFNDVGFRCAKDAPKSNHKVK